MKCEVSEKNPISKLHTVPRLCSFSVNTRELVKDYYDLHWTANLE